MGMQPWAWESRGAWPSVTTSARLSRRSNPAVDLRSSFHRPPARDLGPGSQGHACLGVSLGVEHAAINASHPVESPPCESPLRTVATTSSTYLPRRHPPMHCLCIILSVSVLGFEHMGCEVVPLAEKPCLS
jgi:hypothetical protein